MPLLDTAFICGALILGLSIYTRHGGAISQHPYRNPDGAAPGASRRAALTPEHRESLYLARRGTR